MVRDRNIVFAVLMYIPLPAVSGVVLIVDLILRGNTFRRGRYLSSVSALLLVAWSSPTLVGWRSPEPMHTGADTVQVLHWNVLWGGRGEAGAWQNLSAEIRRRNPSIVILSEAPTPAALASLQRDLGTGWNCVAWRHEKGERYTNHLAVLSSDPIAIEERLSSQDARMMQVRIDRPAGAMRILVCDGLSNPFLARSPRLAWIRSHVEQLHRQGIAVDLIAGDFNSLGRCIGFDAFHTMAGGFERASDFSAQWRCTWPMILPLWDIDHVWVSNSHAIIAADLFTARNSDHRGQVVTLFKPGSISLPSP